MVYFLCSSQALIAGTFPPDYICVPNPDTKYYAAMDITEMHHTGALAVYGVDEQAVVDIDNIRMI